MRHGTFKNKCLLNIMTVSVCIANSKMQPIPIGCDHRM